MESTHLSGKEIVSANQDESGLQVLGETSFLSQNSDEFLAEKKDATLNDDDALVSDEDASISDFSEEEDISNNENYLQIAFVAAEHIELTLCADEAAFQLLDTLKEKKKELVKANKWMLSTSDSELVEEEEEVLNARGIKRKNRPGRPKNQKVGRHDRYLSVLETKNRGISKSSNNGRAKKKLSFQGFDKNHGFDKSHGGST
uniref:Uncharacterized protein n=1 Tax=Brassica campestris TaxID=3711 RepID=M4CSK4_BRACM